MVWLAAALFAVAGVFMIIRRNEIARGQSMMWGGTTVPGCVVVQGALVVLIGLAFVVLWQLGLLGDV